MFQKHRSKVAAPVKAIGPAWTRGEIEKPAGTKDMGGYKAAASHLAFNFDVNTAILVHFMMSLLIASWCYKVYTSEQQERLGHTFVGEQCWHGSTRV